MRYPLKQSTLAKVEGSKTWVFNNQANIFHPMSAHFRAAKRTKALSTTRRIAIGYCNKQKRTLLL